jgi:hypothetical protein
MVLAMYPGGLFNHSPRSKVAYYYIDSSMDDVEFYRAAVQGCDSSPLDYTLQKVYTAVDHLLHASTFIQ